MSARSLDIAMFGLSITSSWGNGHATTYRALTRELAARGHRVRFYERDVPWYASSRDCDAPEGVEVVLYTGLDHLASHWEHTIARADMVLVGSYVPDGITLGNWVLSTNRNIRAFYDIDTPVTLSRLATNDCEYVTPDLIARYDLYLSFSGGKAVTTLQNRFNAVNVHPFYCSVDPAAYYPMEMHPQYDLGYMGTYADDRQPPLDRLLIKPARHWESGRFIVAGPLYPDTVQWPQNVHRVQHIPPAHHRSFYNSQRFTLNVTRADMVRAGHSPSVRLFEAAACATPIISDDWEGLSDFLTPGEQILISHSPEETLDILINVPERRRRRIGAAARSRILAQHTATHRARQLETIVRALR